MARYELNYDLRQPEDGDYKVLEQGLTELFGEVEDGELDSMYKFRSNAEYPEGVRNDIKKFFDMKLAMRFEVINLDSGRNAEGETELAFIKRVGGF